MLKPAFRVYTLWWGLRGLRLRVADMLLRPKVGPDARRTDRSLRGYGNVARGLLRQSPGPVWLMIWPWLLRDDVLKEPA